MKIATRLTLGFALIILFICLQGAVALIKSSAVASGFHQISTQDMPNVVMLSEIDENRHIIAEALRDMLIVKEVEHYEALKQQVYASRQRIGQVVEQLQAQMADAESHALLGDVLAQRKNYVQAQEHLIQQLDKGNEGSARNYLLDEFGTILNDYGRALAALKSLQSARLNASVTQAQANIDSIQRGVWLSVGLALVAAVKGYKLILVMPDSMSIERRRLMLAYVASFDLTPKEKGMKGAIARAEELAAQVPNAWIPQQFDNPANADIHASTTAQEVLADFPDGLDALITGVSTGGHLTGVARVLKAKFPQLKVFAVEPKESAVISGGAAGPHAIQGLGAGFIPKNLDTSLLDGTIQVEAEAAREYARRAAAQEGLLVGISSGATLAAIAQKLPELPAGSRVLGFAYDTGERYLSVPGFLPTE